MDLIDELKKVILAYEQPCVECEEEATRVAMATGRIAELRGDQPFVPDLLAPPAEWFAELPSWMADLPKNKIYADDEGRVAGYVTQWDQCILDGSRECWKPPRLPDNYDLAYQGITETADGGLLATADLAATEGHAVFDDWTMSLAHNLGDISEAGYPIDDAQKIRSKMARVRFINTPEGLAAVGALYPTTTASQVVLMRGSAISGHWQYVPEKGMSFLGAVFVNKPGLPIRKVACNEGYAIVMAEKNTVLAANPMPMAPDPEAETPVVDVAPPASPMADMGKLEDRIAELEGKLEEYEIAVNERLDQHEQLIAKSAMEQVTVDPLPQGY